MKHSAFSSSFQRIGLVILCMSLMLTGIQANATSIQSPKEDIKNTEDLLFAQFIQTKGSSTIVFDSSNIKQFWTDKSISCSDDLISIQLKGIDNASQPLKIQLSNVLETDDCEITIISNTADMTFSVSNNKSVVQTTSTSDGMFLQYHVFSSTYHLESSTDFSFNLIFNSKTQNTIKVKRIILSFSNNKKSHYAGSSGYIQMIKEFDEKGISVANSEIKYILSPQYNKIFIRIPKETVFSYPFFYHVFPTDKENLQEDRVQAGYNNLDNSMYSSYMIIPMPYPFDYPYTIIQEDLPSYPFSLIRMGQYDLQSRKWQIELKP